MIAFRFLLIILFSICIMGCRTTGGIEQNGSFMNWQVPEKPITLPVNFVERDDGLFIDKQGSINLLKNIEGMDAYTLKLEVLVDEMKQYYGEK